MSEPKASNARRRFLKTLAVGIAASPVAAALSSRAARAQDLPHLDESDPTAMALGYKHDVAQVDKAKFPQLKPGDTCANCNFFQRKGDEEWAPCQLFPGKAVHANGWCAGHAPKKA
jgi:hypothetical protein